MGLWKDQQIIAVYVKNLPTSCTACNFQYMNATEEDVRCGCVFLDERLETAFPEDEGRRPCCPLKKATSKMKKNVYKCRFMKRGEHLT